MRTERAEVANAAVAINSLVIVHPGTGKDIGYGTQVYLDGRIQNDVTKLVLTITVDERMTVEITRLA